MLIAVLDDTGTHDQAEYCSCIGVTAGLRHWENFVREWHEVLSKYGVKDFHAVDFYARDRNGERVGEFRGWDDEKARSFIQSMTALFSLMNAHIIGTCVEVSSFRALPKNERAFLTGQMVNNKTGKGILSGAPTKPFLLAFAAVLEQALSHKKEKVPLAILLDKNDHLAKQAAVICYQRARLFGDRIAGLQTPSRRDFIGLHLADEIAYLWNRLITKRKLTEEQLFAYNKFGTKKGGKIQLLDGNSIADLRIKYAGLFARS